MNVPEGLPRRAAPAALLPVLWAQPAAAQDATILFIALAPPTFLSPVLVLVLLAVVTWVVLASYG